MRAELAQMRDRLKTTTLYVTHDQVEAMTLGDRVAVINNGVVQQLDRPQALYNEPANVFVAAFMGSPSMNLIEASVTTDGASRVKMTFISAPSSSMTSTSTSIAGSEASRVSAASSNSLGRTPTISLPPS